MKLYISIFVFLFISLSCVAQSDRPGNTVSVRYDFTTVRNGVVFQQKGEFYYAGQKSIFVTNKRNADGLRVYMANDSMAVLPGALLDELYPDTIGNYYVKDFVQKSIFEREVSYQQAYLTDEPMSVLNWMIVADSARKIGDYHCNLARLDFRGRTYSAWFSTDIPVNDGPWKFHSLPGLILDVYDQTGQVRFTATHIDIPAAFQLSFIPAEVGKKVDWATFKQADEIEVEKIKNRIQASQTDRGSTMTVNIEKFKFLELNYE